MFDDGALAGLPRSDCNHRLVVVHGYTDSGAAGRKGEEELDAVRFPNSAPTNLNVAYGRVSN